LGVQCEDFNFDENQRRAARRQLGLADNAVVFLFVGRLDPESKAHPQAMYWALQQLAARRKAPVALIQCGWFATKEMEKAYSDGAKTHCPDVAARFLDGRQASQRTTAWSAADVFVSLSDNIQETFGLTPIEGMAAGLPSVVSDWDGYRDTVRHGVDGFRIPTWMPAAPAGNAFALAHEAGSIPYTAYITQVSQTVSVDRAALQSAITALADDPALRRKMGAAARARAREVFDWSTVFARYLSLVEELDGLRRSYPDLWASPPPTHNPARADPYTRFAGYPTRKIDDETLVSLVKPAPATVDALKTDPLFANLSGGLVSARAAQRVLDAIAGEEAVGVGIVAARTGIPSVEARRAVGWLAKVGLIRLRQSSPSR
jgi:starch synthase